MIINACIFTVHCVTHFISGISLFIVCLHEEIDDGFAFLLFARYKLWFPLLQDVSLAKVNPNRMLLESPIAKPPASDHPKWSSSHFLEVVAYKNRTTRGSFLEEDRTHLHFGREFSVSNYSQTSLIRTSKGQNQLFALQRCPCYRGRERMIFGISETKQTVRNREVSVLRKFR